MKTINVLSISFIGGLLLITGCSKSEDKSVEVSEASEPAAAPSSVIPNEIVDAVKQQAVDKTKEVMTDLREQANAEMDKLKSQLKLEGDDLLASFGGSDSTTSSLVQGVVSKALDGNESDALSSMKSLYQLGSSFLGSEKLSSLNGFRDTLSQLALTKLFGCEEGGTHELLNRALSALGQSDNESGVLSALSKLSALKSLSGQQSGLLDTLTNLYKPSAVDQAKGAVESISKGLSNFGLGE